MADLAATKPTVTSRNLSRWFRWRLVDKSSETTVTTPLRERAIWFRPLARIPPSSAHRAAALRLGLRFASGSLSASQSQKDHLAAPPSNRTACLTIKRTSAKVLISSTGVLTINDTTPRRSRAGCLPDRGAESLARLRGLRAVRQRTAGKAHQRACQRVFDRCSLSACFPACSIAIVWLASALILRAKIGKRPVSLDQRAEPKGIYGRSEARLTVWDARARLNARPGETMALAVLDRASMKGGRGWGWGRTAAPADNSTSSPDFAPGFSELRCCNLLRGC